MTKVFIVIHPNFIQYNYGTSEGCVTYTDFDSVDDEIGALIRQLRQEIKQPVFIISEA
jgi:hypothetical protein